MELLLDCTGGARKDSLVAALFAMLPEERRGPFAERFSQLGFGYGIDDVSVPEKHAPGHSHEHHSVGEVRDAINALDVSDAVKHDALGVYAILADAEAKAHGVPVEDVHFHEVGNAAAIASIAAACMLVEELAPEEIASTPIATGFGFVDCAHGRLPVPAPATANVLDGLPAFAGDVEGELTTPTGAAIVRHFATRFTRPEDGGTE